LLEKKWGGILKAKQQTNEKRKGEEEGKDHTFASQNRKEKEKGPGKGIKLTRGGGNRGQRRRPH